MNIFDIEFCEFSMLADNPKALEKYKNRFYDPEFDDWLAEVEAEATQPKEKPKNPFDYSEYEVKYDEEGNEIAPEINSKDLGEEVINSDKETTLNQQIEGEDDEFVVIDTPDIDTRNITDWEEA